MQDSGRQQEKKSHYEDALAQRMQIFTRPSTKSAQNVDGSFKINLPSTKKPIFVDGMSQNVR